MFTAKDLPEEISVNATKYKVRTDFKDWIAVESIFNDSKIPIEYKLYVIYNNLDLFFGNEKIFDEPMDAVFDGILSFWRMNRSDKKEGMSVIKDIPYDYGEDFSLICAAFKQQYNINLRKEDMHWFEYKSLFDGLTKDTQFIRIVGYRTIDLNKIPKDQRKEYRKLKEYYSIRKQNTGKRSQKEIEAELLARIRES